MKITFYPTVAFAFVTCVMFATSCANDVETDTNIDPVGNAISFSPSVGHSTRATEIDISNLGDFAVMARGMHHDGALYENYLIGSNEKGGEIAHYIPSSNNESSNIWELERSVYWPASLERVLFIGYTTLKRDTQTNKSDSSDDGVLGEATFTINNSKPTISNFIPLKDDINKDKGENGIWADGENQKDLLVAFKQQDRGTQTTVNLVFRHALTQVSITAQQKNKASNDHRIVKVKGAWIVNVAQSGILTADISVANKEASNKTSWTSNSTNSTNSTNITTYGAYYNDMISLDNEKVKPKDLLRHSLMLIPQTLQAWDGKSATTNDAYIMLLCRVELEHDGVSHTGNDITDIAIVDNVNTQKHYHQLFPVNTEKYDGSEYGFVCVPLNTDWGNTENNAEDCKGAGKHYTYNLDICGATTGAGVYPPIPQNETDAQALINKLIPTEATVLALVLKDGKYIEERIPLCVVTQRPSDKNAGSPVLDEPIKFSVSVKDWTDENLVWDEENNQWKPGTSTTPTDE